MPRSTISNRYPVQFLDLAQRFEKDPTKEVVIEFGDEKKAKAFQLELHSFRAALRKENVIDSYPNFNHVELRLTPSKTGVILVDKDWTPTALAVQQALDQLDKEPRPLDGEGQ